MSECRKNGSECRRDNRGAIFSQETQDAASDFSNLAKAYRFFMLHMYIGKVKIQKPEESAVRAVEALVESLAYGPNTNGAILEWGLPLRWRTAMSFTTPEHKFIFFEGEKSSVAGSQYTSATEHWGSPLSWEKNYLTPLEYQRKVSNLLARVVNTVAGGY